MKKKLSVLVSGVALMALFAAPVSALVSGEEEASKVNLSCLVGAGVEADVAKAHLVDVLNVAEEAVVYDEEGNLELKVEHEENDFAFDEIGSVLKIKQLQQTKRELFESLETFYRVFYLGEE